MKKTVLILTVLFFMSELVFARPAWLTAENRKYPRAKYLTGVGVGANLETARENARAEVAKIFSTKIWQVFRDTAKETTEKGKTRWSNISESSVIVSVEDVIEGIVIAHTWRDRKEKKYYAFAVLEKSKYRRRLSNKIMELTAAINSRISKASSSKSMFDALKNLAEAKRISEQLQLLSLRRMVVEDSVRPAMFGEPVGSLSPYYMEKKLEDAKKKVIFNVVGSGEHSLRTEKTIGATLNRMGFNVKADSLEKAPVLLKVFLNAEPFTRGTSGWQFYGWSGNYSIEEDGRIIFSETLRGSESHPDEFAAKEKALSSALNAIVISLENKLSDY